MHNNNKESLPMGGSVSNIMSQEIDIDFTNMWNVLMRRRIVLANVTLAVLLMAGLFIFMQTPRYTAHAVLLFEPANDSVVDIKAVMSGLSSADAALDSQIDVIKSRMLLAKIVDKLDLYNDKAFNPSAKSVWGSVKDFFRDEAPAAELNEAERLQIRGRLVDSLQGGLKVIRKVKSHIVTVSFTSTDRDLAKKLANIIVDEYLIDQLDARFSATKLANEWLQDRVKILRDQVRQSEHAVQRFREKHDLTGIGGKSSVNNQLSELNTQLIIARTARAQSAAALQQTKEALKEKNGIYAIAEVLNSPLIKDLRVKEAAFRQNLSEYKGRYGPKHPVMINAAVEYKELRRNIAAEVNKIIRGIKNDLQKAHVNEKNLQNALEKLRKTLNVSNSFEMQLIDLVREMEANQELYQAFLVRFKETADDQNFYQSDARVIAYAELPRKASWPRKKLVLIVATVLGMFLGLCAIIILEYFDNAFRNLNQIEATLGVPGIGVLPEIKDKMGPVDYAIAKVASAYAEALRSVNTAVHFSNPDNPPKSLVITSSVPHEGKSVFAASLARLVAKSGSKVLLVDCDMRLPTVHKTFQSSLTKGLDAYLMNEAELEEIIEVDDKSGLHYIRSFKETPHSQELLGSVKMADFMRMASQSYDLVVLDAPPIMALADAIVLSHAADATILLSRWEKTPRNVVKEALKRLNSSNINVAGVVLSRVDLDKQSRYSYGDAGYYYGKYKDYYTS
jgi:succinoglycan biosynthesis transport protein ExoP